MTKILIVDDEAMMRMVAKRILSEQYQILTASSGAEALEVYEREKPELVLSDILMPEMSGFELQEKLYSRYGDHIKIMFMTADESQETADTSQRSGAVDFIRKPFQPNSLLRRVEQLLGDSFTTSNDDPTVDALTGLPARDGVGDQLRAACLECRGTLMIMDIDCLKLVNDIYGTNIGDILLQGFAEIVRANTRSGDIIGRLSGDEFITFIKNVTDENAISSITRRINDGLIGYAHELMGEAMSIPLGVSTGAVYVPENGTNYDALFRAADNALLSVKQRGKHGHAVYKKVAEVPPVMSMEAAGEDDGGLRRFTQMFGELQPHSGAFFIKPESFDYLFQFLMRYTITYHRTACKLLFSISPKSPNVDVNCFAEAISCFGDTISAMLRKSDLIAQVEENEYLLFLPEISEPDANKLVSRLLKGWEAKAFSATVNVEYEMEMVNGDSDEDAADRRSTD